MCRMSKSCVTPIVLACDENYLCMTAVAIHSILRHRKANRYTEIYVFGDHLSEESLSYLRRIGDAYSHVKITAENMDSSFLKGCKYGVWTQAANVRLVLAMMPQFRDFSKALWLDCDTLVTDDLGELLDLNLGGYHLAAMPEILVNRFSNQGKRLQLTRPENYFNSGVCLLNLDVIREQNIAEAWRYLLRNHDSRLVMLDQDAMNLISSENYRHLGIKWNTFANVCLPKKEIPKIIHWAGPSRPFRSVSQKRYRDIYQKFLEQLGDKKIQNWFINEKKKWRWKNVFDALQLRRLEYQIRCLRDALKRKFSSER